MMLGSSISYGMRCVLLGSCQTNQAIVEYEEVLRRLLGAQHPMFDSSHAHAPDNCRNKDGDFSEEGGYSCLPDPLGSGGDRGIVVMVLNNLGVAYGVF